MNCKNKKRITYKVWCFLIEFSLIIKQIGIKKRTSITKKTESPSMPKGINGSVTFIEKIDCSIFVSVMNCIY
jgi:hypothetical protein